MDALGLAVSVAQLPGVDAFVKLVSMIVQAAKTARRNKKTCLELAQLVEQVADLLRTLQEQPGVTVMESRETSAPLREFLETIQRAYVLVQSCRGGGYARRLCADGDQAVRLRDVQSRISIYLQLFPIICHIDGTRLLVRIMADNGAAARSPRSEDIQIDEGQLLGWPSLTNHPIDPKARFQRLSFSQLRATEGFSDDRQMERSALAILYKGKLDGSDVTIKKLSVSTSGQRLPKFMSEHELFENEIKILPTLQHANVVKPVGFCTELSERVMDYEYMQNGSLEDVIFGRLAAGLILDWPSRFRIIEGIAQGAAYLHNYSRERIIHRDLKPSNILLDSDMSPKISNFELAEMLSSAVDDKKTDHVIGSM